jgi:hypothetical protein
MIMLTPADPVLVDLSTTIFLGAVAFLAGVVTTLLWQGRRSKHVE